MRPPRTPDLPYADVSTPGSCPTHAWSSPRSPVQHTQLEVRCLERRLGSGSRPCTPSGLGLASGLGLGVRMGGLPLLSWVAPGQRLTCFARPNGLSEVQPIHGPWHNAQVPGLSSLQPHVCPWPLLPAHLLGSASRLWAKAAKPGRGGGWPGSCWDRSGPAFAGNGGRGWPQCHAPHVPRRRPLRTRGPSPGARWARGSLI